LLCASASSAAISSPIAIGSKFDRTARSFVIDREGRVYKSLGENRCDPLGGERAPPRTPQGYLRARQDRPEPAEGVAADRSRLAAKPKPATGRQDHLCQIGLHAGAGALRPTWAATPSGLEVPRIRGVHALQLCGVGATHDHFSDHLLNGVSTKVRVVRRRRHLETLPDVHRELRRVGGRRISLPPPVVP
jgi:hypothetical protein